jgi:aldose 1-epimerase
MISRTNFGQTADGTLVDLFTLTGSGGAIAKLTSYGAMLTELHVPDRAGRLANVVLGFDNLASYLGGHPFFGCMAGRVANRIAGAKFELGAQTYTLTANNGPNNLHSGPQGIDKRVWHTSAGVVDGEPQVRFSLLSPHGDGGFPGNLSIRVTYTLTKTNAIRIEYHAVTDRATLCNLTNHSYFNLAGAGHGDILNHELTIAADHYLPVDATLIPTGELRRVSGTPFDFTTPHTIGSRLAATGSGYDHNFCLNSRDGSLAFCARATEPTSGRVMEVYTTEPGVQFYTANFLDGSIQGNGGIYPKHAGFCLECQRWPDAIHHPTFPTVVLEPGQEYRQTTEYRFSAK